MPTTQIYTYYHTLSLHAALPIEPKANAPAYTHVFAESLIAEAEADDRVVAITAAMPAGTGLDRFAKRFPERSFDVGIAEQHAVTFADRKSTRLNSSH